ncbi:DUF4031 domain-containing protein [Coralliovum pocilloporae]|uniref:DUF4031 domain-containing protein n=1 Tax=Coralliovum pocilloporae TaxID=3066369 RepID=UPI003307750A
MTVYVDRARHPFKGMIMCHMLADTEEELHQMARRLGMKREWFQPKSSPHYDIDENRRAKALEMGAQEISRRDLVDLIRRIRREPRTFWLPGHELK